MMSRIITAETTTVVEVKLRLFTKMYIGMYYKKVKELEKIKRMLLGLYENSNDHVRYEIDNILDELSGTRRM